VSEEDSKRLETVIAKFTAYAAPDFGPRKPDEAAESVLKAIERSSLEAGYGGSFLSYNGTRRWM
jgi:hypothetical protein